MEFRLSQGRINTGKQGSNLAANTISVTKAASVLSTPQLSSGAGQVSFTPSRIPQTIQDQTSSAIQNFMGVVAESAFRYQERESTFQAKELVLQYEKASQDALAGSVNEDGTLNKGYMHTQGVEALGAYSDLQESAEGLFNTILDGAAPNVRQKALIQMHNTKSTLLNKAAQHRTRQLGLAEKEQQNLRLKNLSFQIALSPESIYAVIPGTNNSTLKSLFYSEFSSGQQADAAWYDLMERTTQKVFLETEARELASDSQGKRDRATETAFASASAFFNSTSGPETLASADHRARILGDVRKWRGYSVSSFNDRKASVKAENDRITKERTDNGSVQLAVDLASGKHFTPESIQKLEKQGIITPTKAVSVINSLKNREGGIDPIFDIDEYKRVQGLTLRQDPSAKLEIETSNLPEVNKRELRSLYTSSIGINFRNQYTSLQQELQGIISQEYDKYMVNLNKDSIDGRAAVLMREYDDRRRAQEPTESIAEDFRGRLAIAKDNKNHVTPASASFKKPEQPIQGPDGFIMNSKESIKAGNEIYQKILSSKGASSEEALQWKRSLLEAMTKVTETRGVE